MSDTKIEWADKTWNPITGCTPVSEGCQNCYAERIVKRFGRTGTYAGASRDFSIPLFHKSRLDHPSKWKKPSRIFVSSMGDLFHESVPSDWIAQVIARTLFSHHTFLVLTKRPERMRAMTRDIDWQVHHQVSFDHLWLGVTAENQERYDERVPILWDIQTAKRFISIEPMLGPINLDIDPWFGFNTLTDWVICGAETGSGARLMNPEWALSVRDQCKEAGVSFFMKQMSKKEPIPEDLMVREFPEYEGGEEDERSGTPRGFRVAG